MKAILLSLAALFAAFFTALGQKPGNYVGIVKTDIVAMNQKSCPKLNVAQAQWSPKYTYAIITVDLYKGNEMVKNNVHVAVLVDAFPTIGGTPGTLKHNDHVSVRLGTLWGDYNGEPIYAMAENYPIVPEP